MALFQIHDRTRDETYTTDHEDNAVGFLHAHRVKHPDHAVELWRQRVDGAWERVEV